MLLGFLERGGLSSSSRAGSHLHKCWSRTGGWTDTRGRGRVMLTRDLLELVSEK